MPTPERTCIGCRSAKPVTELVRIVRRSDGSIRRAASSSGRGAWLCRGADACLEQAIRRRAFARAFRAEVTSDALSVIAADLAEEVS